jgi:hypothetical protein
MASKKRVVDKPDTIPDAPMGESDGPSSAGWHKIESGFRCFKEYQYEQIRGIESPQHAMPDPFAIGQMMHTGKGRWFSKQFKSDEATLDDIREEMLASAIKAKLPMSNKAQLSALKYFTEYVEHWRVRAKPRVLAAEYLIGPAVFREEDGGRPLFARTARLDDVSYYPEAGNALCIGESKTTSTNISDAVNQYSLHGQPMLQDLLWRVSPQGEKMHGPIAGVMLDVIVKGYDGKKSTFGRMMLPITDRARLWFEKNFRHTVKILSNISWDTNAPRNISACTRMYGRARVACKYRDLCMHGRSASVKYVLPGGKSLVQWKPDEERGMTVPPWE